jgi:hypothetical protein
MLLDLRDLNLECESKAQVGKIRRYFGLVRGQTWWLSYDLDGTGEGPRSGAADILSFDFLFQGQLRLELSFSEDLSIAEVDQKYCSQSASRSCNISSPRQCSTISTATEE